ncbi:MAG: hypothetical protein IPM85_05890 [Chitinophagaceae bacterium]|nr:hypothetical protein [Chitinophagaceae bacterium]
MTGSGKTFTQSGGTFTGTNINWIVNSGADLTLLNNLTIAASRSLTAAGTVTTNSGTANINGIFQLNDGGWGGGTLALCMACQQHLFSTQPATMA